MKGSCRTLMNSFSSVSRASNASISSSTFSGLVVMAHRRKQQDHRSIRSALFGEGCELRVVCRCVWRVKEIICGREEWLDAILARLVIASTRLSLIAPADMTA